MRAARLALLAFSAMLDDLMMSDLAAVAGSRLLSTIT
jgi:hypothetical protein